MNNPIEFHKNPIDNPLQSITIHYNPIQSHIIPCFSKIGHESRPSPSCCIFRSADQSCDEFAEDGLDPERRGRRDTLNDTTVMGRHGWCGWVDIPIGYGSIPINTIFSGMNIHLPAILMFTRGTRFWHTAICSMYGKLNYGKLLQNYGKIHHFFWENSL